MSNTDLLSGDVDTQATPQVESGAGEKANGTTAAPKRRTGGLSGMVIADLRELATELGVGDTTGMRKGDLIAAIRERQGKTKRRTSAASNNTLPLDGIGGDKPAEKTAEPAQPEPQQPAQEPKARTEETKAPAAEAQQQGGSAEAQQGEDTGRREGSRRRRSSSRAAGSPDAGGQRGGDQSGDQRSGQQQRGDQGGGDQRRQNDRQQNNQQNQRGQQGNRSDDDEDGGGRRGRRFRDRRRRGSGGGRGDGGPDTEIREDDVLLPVAGILDVLDNYAFVRTSGYLAGPNDVYVSLSLVRKFGLRRGDAITGVVRQPREGEQQRQKFNPLVRVDTINGLEPEQAKKRAEFTKLTPLYPNERLRLETEPHKLTTRVIDLVMPVGKGQRALIVSPPKAGKTTIMQDIANAITTNNPECHLMVVLVDERPEEVTDMQRSVKGEVIASTFDRPPSDHTSVAELSIERAKRLVEMGMDVVVLLDSITRLGRAYNLAAPASGRILSGGVDSTALFPPKRFLGAARNIENGGSLTIFATAMVETGSTGDTVIFEEFKGTGNAELKLDRKIAERRVFPAVDVNPSGTRKEELLLSPDELAVTHKLHRVLHALDSQQAIDLLISRLRKTKTNIEFLMQVSKTALGPDED
ncbi:transcription termination factor Rho [Amycolatopsis anabasis]|uniref:transcription termination factor Rho n=1 Tax=Amycolatopsis anabasis TaxID=1840409 RepID=UPI00131A813D|nr:transcription termination factor Rho [Amycolatopsis anabasis]